MSFLGAFCRFQAFVLGAGGVRAAGLTAVIYPHVRHLFESEIGRRLGA
jgi:hypothetical protein